MVVCCSTTGSGHHIEISWPIFNSRGERGKMYPLMKQHIIEPVLLFVIADVFLLTCYDLIASWRSNIKMYNDDITS